VILITGGTGFVGSALASHLAHLNQPVRALCRRAPNPTDQLVEVVSGVDLLSNPDLRFLLKDVSTVVHTAARVHVMNEDSRDPLGSFRAMNVDATLSLARQASLSGVKRFIFLSSIKVNGEVTLENSMFHANDTPDPQDFYATSKLEAEFGLKQIAAQTGLEVVIVRPPLIIGPGVKGNFLRLLKLAKSGIPLPFGRVTENRRSLVGLSNLVDFLSLCCTHPNAANQTFLVSDGEDLSTAELLYRISTHMDHRVRLLPIPISLLTQTMSLLGAANSAQRLFGSLRVDIQKNAALLDWRPAFSLETDLKRTVDFFLQQAGAANMPSRKVP
jgi:nucleoside-diphosphate-sugar epimerase